MSLFRPLLPDGVRVAEMDPRGADPAGLHPEERAAVRVAVDRRLREFAAGRLLARQLLGDVTLLNAADGPPRWPAGVVGSVTHCRGLAAVAVAEAHRCRGLGLDVEPDEPLPPGVAELVTLASERAWLAVQPAGAPARDRWIFCAKEAAYKAIYPITRRFLDFSAMEIRGDARAFEARLLVSAPPFAPGDILRGRWRAHEGHVGAAVVLEG